MQGCWIICNAPHREELPCFQHDFVMSHKMLVHVKELLRRAGRSPAPGRTARAPKSGRRRLGTRGPRSRRRARTPAGTRTHTHPTHTGSRSRSPSAESCSSCGFARGRGGACALCAVRVQAGGASLTNRTRHKVRSAAGRVRGGRTGADGGGRGAGLPRAALLLPGPAHPAQRHVNKCFLLSAFTRARPGLQTPGRPLPRARRSARPAPRTWPWSRRLQPERPARPQGELPSAPEASRARPYLAPRLRPEKYLLSVTVPSPAWLGNISVTWHPGLSSSCDCSW
ncbi:uncharacterized protein LOC144298744 [Canis aureus]